MVFSRPPALRKEGLRRRRQLLWEAIGRQALAVVVDWREGRLSDCGALGAVRHGSCGVRWEAESGRGAERS